MTDGVPQNNFDPSFRVLPLHKLPHENSPVFILRSNLTNQPPHINDLTGRISGDVEYNPIHKLLIDLLAHFLHKMVHIPVPTLVEGDLDLIHDQVVLQMGQFESFEGVVDDGE